MTDPLIWTLDDILRFTHEPLRGDRAWAWDWLQRHHGAEAARQATRAILDPEPSIARAGVAILAARPAAEVRETLEDLRRRTDLAPGVRAAIDQLENPEPEPPRTFDDPINDAIVLLSPQHDELRREAPAMLKSRDLKTFLVALGALGNQQFQWATDILLEAFPILVTRDDPSMLWDTLDQLRDPRALPALAAVWVPGETYVATLYAAIHRLAGPGSVMPAGIARDVEEEKARVAAMVARRQHPAAGEPLASRRLQIRCAACGRTGEYDVALEKLPEIATYNEAEKAGIELPERTVFECKHCGGKNAYELGAFSRISLAGGLRDLEKREKGGG